MKSLCNKAKRYLQKLKQISVFTPNFKTSRLQDFKTSRLQDFIPSTDQNLVELYKETVCLS